MASIDIVCIRIRIGLKIIRPRANGKSNLIRGGRYNNIYYIKKKSELVFKANPTDNDTINKNLNNTGIFYTLFILRIFFLNLFIHTSLALQL